MRVATSKGQGGVANDGLDAGDDSATPGEDGPDAGALIERPSWWGERGGQLGGLLAPLFFGACHHRAMSEAVPFPASQCHGCRHKQDVKTSRSHFLRCVVRESKYPPQPVLTCPEFEPKAPTTTN